MTGVKDPWFIQKFTGGSMIGVGIGHEVILVDRDSKKSYKFGKYGSYPGQLEAISGVAFSSVGNILVADNILNRVSMFSSEGEFILCFGTSRQDVRN
jgi:DNA-binding beta-propeller fold protein YncE